MQIIIVIFVTYKHHAMNDCNIVVCCAGWTVVTCTF